ncbi:MAG TPA: tetratricopeptide repeat protein [Xanthobacteraceae bacterium]|jgi:Flp pilus assembly protein TadD
MSSRPSKTVLQHQVAFAVTAALLAITIAACKTIESDDSTSSYAMAAAPQNEADARSAVEASGERYRAKPEDPQAAISYAHGLRAAGRRQEAAAVLEQATMHNPKNMELLGAYGRALADVGNYQQALDVLSRAHTPDHPDWRILSVQGVVLDQMGHHDEAQRYYATALKIAPDEPSVLSNLGLSYALSKDLVRAEMTLRRALGRPRVDPRVRQNLALVVGLQGRFAEAESIARSDLPPEIAAANVSYLRQMLAQQNGLHAPAAKPRS